MDKKVSLLIYENFGIFDSVRMDNKKTYPVYLKFGHFSSIDYNILNRILPTYLKAKELRFEENNFDFCLYVLNRKNGKDERNIYETTRRKSRK